MLKNDLNYILPDANGLAVCSLSLRDLSRSAVKLVEAMKEEADNT